MDFLKQIALPQSAGEITVLHFVLNFVYIIFLPFVSYLFGALVLSLYYGRFGRKHSDAYAVNLSKDILEHILPNKSILFLFGVVPYMAIVFAYAQLLQGTTAMSVSLLTWGACIFAAGTVFASSYHAALKLSSVLENVSQKNEEVENVRTEAVETKHTSGKYAVLFLAVSMALFLAGTTHAADPAQWEVVGSVIELLFTLDVVIRLVQFVLLSFTLTALGTLYFTFSWQGGIKNLKSEYTEYLKNKLLTLALVAILLQPIFIALSVLSNPNGGLSGIFFGAAFFGILLLFIIIHFVYGMIKEFNPVYSANAFFLIIFVFLSNSIQDNSALSRATQQQSMMLAYQYDKYHEELLAKMGINLKVVTGSEIFGAKCSACHEFGKKKIGPAYKDVLPKYESDRAKLLSFILSPQKMNPAFPAMPNQGLKPAEADSIAAYIMTMYKQAP
ncbi:MAG: cytochrome c [Bacteroidota bacterium]|nr:cytochrome c [Bacteroidota bacterium]